MELKVLVEERLEKKKRKAEDAYVKAQTTKETRNCRHHGSSLSDKIYICKLKCQGTDELSAAQCWNEKARGCPDFSLQKSKEALKSEFRNLGDAEIALRWPSIGELLWVKKTLDTLSRDSSDGPKEPQDESQKRAS